MDYITIDMYKGIIEKESLKEHSILNQLNIKEVYKEYHKGEDPPLWHAYKVRIPDKKLGQLIKFLSKNIMISGWFSLFWNNKLVYVVMKDKIIKLKNKKPWDNKEFKKLISYGEKEGIHRKWFDNMINPMSNW